MPWRTRIVGREQAIFSQICLTWLLTVLGETTGRQALAS